MGEGFQFIDIILLAMVAGFVVLRLGSVLGRRTGHEQRRPPMAKPTRDRDDETVVPLPERGRQDEPSTDAPEVDVAPSAMAGLSRIKMVDRSFDAAEFLAGARAAYEMIVTAFAAGEKETLKPLLSDEVFRNFSQAIDQRKRDGHTLETTLVGIKKAEIIDADLKGRHAEVTVRFVSELINATRDASGALVGGNPNAVDEVVDIWTFARDTRSGDPNWLLVGTTTPA